MLLFFKKNCNVIKLAKRQKNDLIARSDKETIRFEDGKLVSEGSMGQKEKWNTRIEKLLVDVLTNHKEKY